MKICPTCKIEKDILEYWKGQSSCIPCQKDKQKNYWDSRTPKRRLEQHLKYKYNLSIERCLEILDEQNGNCAICSDILPDLFQYENRRRGYAIDHNHETGEVRGILCTECNALLGMAQDSVEILSSAIDYLNNKGSYALIDNMRAAK